MPEVARLGDMLEPPCGDIITEGSGNVFAEGMPVTRLDSDKTAGHCFVASTILPGPSGVNVGTVFVNGIEIAIVGDEINNATHLCNGVPHPGPPAQVIIGAATVFAYG